MDFSITLGSDLVGLQSQLQSQDPARQHAQEGQEASSKGTTLRSSLTVGTGWSVSA